MRYAIAAVVEKMNNMRVMNGSMDTSGLFGKEGLNFRDDGAAYVFCGVTVSKLLIPEADGCRAVEVMRLVERLVLRVCEAGDPEVKYFVHVGLLLLV
tara:strand:- start:1217 stop:1507 length:291 start_codon:yes stop_codon:yes gene_type:complete